MTKLPEESNIPTLTPCIREEKSGYSISSNVFIPGGQFDMSSSMQAVSSMAASMKNRIFRVPFIFVCPFVLALCPEDPES
jgi:hypothetical protein